MKANKSIESTGRREFLRKLGGVGLSSAMFKLSLLSGNMLWARSVFAADAPKRAIFVWWPGGAIPDRWMPRGSETDFSLPQGSAPLDSLKQHCVFMRGVNLDGPGHGFSSKGLGTQRSMTVDVSLARTIGQVTPFSQLQLGVISNGFGSVSRYNNNEPAFEDSPYNAFQRLFNGNAGPSVDIETQRQLSVLDCNLETLKQIRSKLGGFEKSRFDEHTAAIERIEERLNDSAGMEVNECANPVFNPNNINVDVRRDRNFDAIADLHIDVITLALKCDLTRVVTFMLGNNSCDWTVPQAGVSTSYHGSIHARPAEHYTQYTAYFASKLAYLIKSLSETRDMDGRTLLDNTVLMTCSDMADARGHSGNDVPYIFAGGGGGTLNTGRYLTFNGISHNRLLDSVAQAMGIDVNGGGYQRHRDGPVDGIFN
jgi:hypothetical protein